jgi:HEAT repeat protein
MSPTTFLFYFSGEQPAIIARPGEPIRFGTMYHRSQELLAAHVGIVRPLIREDLRSNHRERVTHAVGVIGWLRLHEFYDEVVAALRQGTVEYRAAETLRDLDDPRAIRVLTEQTPEDPLRYYTSLIHLCKRRPADPALMKYLRSADAKTRWRAAHALSSSGDPILAPEVARLAKDPDPEVREQAARMSQFIVTDQLGPDRKAVLALLDDKDVDVRIAAARRFAGQRDRACARTLLALLGDDSLEELQHAQVWKAVRDLAGTQFGYYHGSDGWRPTTEANKAALRKFAAWVDQIEKKES